MIVFITIPIEINFGDINVVWNITQNVLINLTHLSSSPAIFFLIMHVWEKSYFMHLNWYFWEKKESLPECNISELQCVSLTELIVK